MFIRQIAFTVLLQDTSCHKWVCTDAGSLESNTNKNKNNQAVEIIVNLHTAVTASTNKFRKVSKNENQKRFGFSLHMSIPYTSERAAVKSSEVPSLRNMLFSDKKGIRPQKNYAPITLYGMYLTYTPLPVPPSLLLFEKNIVG